LFEVPLEKPKSALGKNTVHAIQAGILLGYEGLVKGMLQKIREELNDPQLSTVATGGLSTIITNESDMFTLIEPNLTLDGLRIVAECC
jgi:type III pantothenate kinase